MITLSSSQHGLGDTILLTAIAKNIVGPVTVQLPTKAQRFSILFDKLAKVEICDEKELRPTPDYGSGHYTRRKLRGLFGLESECMDIRPLVLHTSPSSELFAADYLKDKPNPVIFVPTCSPKWKNVRNLPEPIARNVFKQLQDSGRTPIVCQSSANFLDIGEHQLNDLDLSKYICLLRQVGIYAGANTGDETLATALNCKIFCYQPEDHGLFSSIEFNYQHPNSTYYTWRVS